MTCTHVRLARSFSAIANSGDPAVLDVKVTMYCRDCRVRFTTVYGTTRPIKGSDQFACVHRGDVIDTGACDLCGDRGQPFEIHACYVHGKCSVLTRQRKLQACVTCPDRKPPE